MNAYTMPALFLGHGSPMNVLEENAYIQAWRQLGETLPKPKAVLAISAHWYTRGTAVTAMEKPRTIHDFGGFPQALFDTQYPAAGSPALAERVADLLAPAETILDRSEWGLDHGAWGVLIKMYPDADVPVVQLSVDGTQPPLYHYQLGQKLAKLRSEGVMIVASGNVVHNLRAVKWQGESEPHDWAVRFNDYVRRQLMEKGEPHPLVNFMQHPDAKMANPTPEHFLPLLYVLGARQEADAVSVPLDGIDMGAISMLSVQVG